MINLNDIFKAKNVECETAFKYLRYIVLGFVFDVHET
jgi:hypothetical protein